MKRIIVVICLLAMACQTQAAILIESSNGVLEPGPTTMAAACAQPNTIHVTSALSSSFSNISGVGGATCKAPVNIHPGGSISPTTTFRFAKPISSIDPEWYPGTDNQKVQSAVNACSVNGWCPLKVRRLYVLTAPITIDRLVNTMQEDFRIIAEGQHAGFSTSSAINMFSSTIASATDPVSEHISFEGIWFYGPSGAYILNGDKFLRIKFRDCFFYGANLATTQNYLQSYDILNCYLNGWTGTWTGTTSGGSGSSHGFFTDLHVDHLKTDGTPAGTAIVFNAAATISGSSLTNNLAEGFNGPFVQALNYNGCTIQGNYFEGPFTSSPIKATGTGTVGLDIGGNLFSLYTVGQYAIDLNAFISYASHGNSSTQSLHNDSLFVWPGLGEGLSSKGDTAAVNLYYGIAGNNIKATGTLTGFTSNPVQFYYVSRNGSTISVSWANQTGTSNATTMTLTGVIPAAWLPNTARAISVGIEDNGVIGTGLVTISSSGISFSRDISGNSFTASGTKGVMGGTVTYNLYP